MSRALFHVISRGISRLFLTKPATAYAEEHLKDHDLQRNMSLFDLLCVGVGGTLGSGVFVLIGYVANVYAGPSAVLSILIAGLVCLCSAASYGELSCRIPSAGSTYAYSYYALGEYPAVVAAWALSLEYGISASAVARSWGDKVTYWVSSLGGSTESVLDDYGINFFAGFISFVCVVILLLGAHVGKLTVNVITIVKVVLIIFMISVGFALFQSSNMQPFTPFGFGGVLGGSTAFFFGFIGFDEVCCLAAEAKNPHVVLPKAVFGTIFIVTVLTCLAAVALSGTQPYEDISTESGFADAFNARGLGWAGQIVSVGEILTLPLVVLVSFLAQPRIQYALAKDGLMPKIFGEVDSKGNLTKGIAITGVVVTLVAIFVPFTYLNDMISAGVLFSFNLSNSAVIVIRRGQYSADVVMEHAWYPCTRYLICFHVVTIVLAFFLVNLISSDGPVATSDVAVSCVLIVVAIAISISLSYKCPENADPDKLTQYRAPFMPFLPMFGILVNYVLIAQLTWLGLILIVSYFGLATVYYFTYCVNSPDTISMKYSQSMRSALLTEDSLQAQESVQFIRSEPRQSEDLSLPPDEGDSIWRDRLSKDALVFRKEEKKEVEPQGCVAQ